MGSIERNKRLYSDVARGLLERQGQMSYLKQGNTVYEDKDIRALIKQFKTFSRYGYQLEHFTKSLYNFLYLQSGFIAHYDKYGFYDYYFSNGDKSLFLEDMKRSLEFFKSCWMYRQGYNRNKVLQGFIDIVQQDYDKALKEEKNIVKQCLS